MSGPKPRAEMPTNVNGPDTDTGSTGPTRDRKPAGGVLKRLKSRRNQPDRRPVTEDELRALGRDITPDEVLGLRAVTRGRKGCIYGGIWFGLTTVKTTMCVLARQLTITVH